MNLDEVEANEDTDSHTSSWIWTGARFKLHDYYIRCRSLQDLLSMIVGGGDRRSILEIMFASKAIPKFSSAIYRDTFLCHVSTNIK